MFPLIFPAITLWSSLCVADTLTFNGLKDNTLYSESSSLSNGKGSWVFAGVNAQGDARRAVIQFDVDAIPPGSTIVSVTLTMFMSMTIAPATNVEMHRLTESWGEGSSNAPGGEGAGTAAATGDATWQHRFFNTVDWATPGGDFDPSASAVQSVDGTGFYTWGSNAALVADVQGWIDVPGSNTGWILIGDESAGGTAKRFDSCNNTLGSPPVLVVKFTTVPLGVSECSPGQAGVVACPCANPPSGLDRGCNNSSGSGGAVLSATGVASLSNDQVRFATSGEFPTALSVVVQGNALVGAGKIFGEGVSCVGGSIKRLRSKNAVGGGIIYPDGIEAKVSVRSAALHDPISPGTSRWYMVYYRDPSLTCAGEANFNATQTLEVLWDF